MKQYEVAMRQDDPTVTLQIPAEILRDLVLRSAENGSSIAVEIATRLARTLERDLEMIEADNDLAYAAFEVVTHSD